MFLTKCLIAQINMNTHPPTIDEDSEREDCFHNMIILLDLVQ